MTEKEGSADLRAVENMFGTSRHIYKYCLVHPVVGDGQSLCSVSLLSTSDLEEHLRRERKRGKWAVFPMQRVCPSTHIGMIWSVKGDRRERRCHTYIFRSAFTS